MHDFLYQAVLTSDLEPTAVESDRFGSLSKFDTCKLFGPWKVFNMGPSILKWGQVRSYYKY